MNGSEKFVINLGNDRFIGLTKRPFEKTKTQKYSNGTKGENELLNDLLHRVILGVTYLSIRKKTKEYETVFFS